MSPTVPDFLFRNSATGAWRVNLDLYYPPFLERLLEAKAAAAARGCHAYSIYGFRTWPEQAKLRLAYLNGTGGKAAPAGLSAHNYGLADDSAIDSDLGKPGLQTDWKPERYAVLGEEVQRVGLVWGMKFGDRPHVQWPGFESAAQLAVLQRIWRDCPALASDVQKLRAVWQYADSLPIPARG